MFPGKCNKRAANSFWLRVGGKECLLIISPHLLDYRNRIKSARCLHRSQHPCYDSPALLCFRSGTTDRPSCKASSARPPPTTEICHFDKASMTYHQDYERTISMKVRSAARRLALALALLLVPTLAVWSLNYQPEEVLANDNEALITSSLVLVEQTPGSTVAASGSPVDGPVTLRSWEDTDHVPSHSPNTPTKPGPRPNPPWKNRGSK